MKNKDEINKIIKYTVDVCLKKYNLNDLKSLNIFTDIAYRSLKKYQYDPISRLNEELFIKQNIINEIDKYMVNKAKDNIEIYNIIEKYLMKVLNITCGMRKDKFLNIKKLGSIKEQAIFDTIENYDDSIKKSINLYVNDIFLNLVNEKIKEKEKQINKK